MIFPINEPLGQILRSPARVKTKGMHWAIGCLDFDSKEIEYYSSLYSEDDFNKFVEVRGFAMLSIVEQKTTSLLGHLALCVNAGSC